MTRIRLPSFGALAMWRHRSGSSIVFPPALPLSKCLLAVESGQPKLCTTQRLSIACPIQHSGAVEGMIHVVDMYPTLAALAGAKLDHNQPLDGMDRSATASEGRCSA